MRIFLIRHGETTGDVENRYGGDYDDHLTEKGKAQAKKLANELSNKKIQVIFSSPKIRAQETIKILSDVLKCEVKIINDIRERNYYGILTGMVKSEAKEKYPDLVENLKEYNKTIEGAEDYNDFKHRINKSFNEIINSDFEIIGVITHGGPIRCIFREILKLGEFKELRDCAIMEFEKNNGKINLIKMDNASLENTIKLNDKKDEEIKIEPELRIKNQELRNKEITKDIKSKEFRQGRQNLDTKIQLDTSTQTVVVKGRKKKKIVPVLRGGRGQAHIKSTYNNTIITVTDLNGAVLFWSSAGKCGFKGPKKSTPYAAGVIVRSIVDKVRSLGVKELDVFVKGIGIGREAAIRALEGNGIRIISIKDVTPIPHGGCRPKKRRRV